MLVPNQKFHLKWKKNIRDWYENRGYVFTKTSDIFEVNAEDLSPGSHQKVKVLCDYCGNVIDVVWKDYIEYKDKRYACGKCRQTKTSEKTLQKRREYLYESAKKFCDSKGYSLLSNKEDIFNIDSIVTYECPKHGMIKTKIYALVLPHGCSYCQYEENSIKLKNTTNDIIEAGNKHGIKIINPEEYVDYYTSNLKCVCSKCGSIYIASYQQIKRGCCLLCPKCSKSESHGETKIRLYLENKKIDFIQQKRFDDCRTTVPLPFDFYIPSKNTIVEYDGEGHFNKVDFRGHDGSETFERTTKNDLIKDNYCKNNKIILIRIPYWSYNTIEKILENELFT